MCIVDFFQQSTVDYVARRKDLFETSGFSMSSPLPRGATLCKLPQRMGGAGTSPSDFH